jgi:uncharacterized protein involved in exopolysaccharide biosynthesis
MTEPTTKAGKRLLAALDKKIADMEWRVLNAASLDGAKAFHRRLDVLRERRAALAKAKEATDG